MKFSIIIPVYNAEKYIKRCVESIIEQNYEENEIILVEDHSTDRSMEICMELEHCHSNILLTQNIRKGASAARNTGIKMASGDVVGFCDADDYLDKNVLNQVRNIFLNNDVDMVYTAFTRIGNGTVYKISVKRDEIIDSSTAIEYIVCNPIIMGSVWNKFYRKELFADTSFPTDLSHLEDGYFNIKLLSHNRESRIYISGINTYFYVQNDCSITNNIDNCYDENGKLKYNNTLYKMIEDISLTKEEVKYIKDDIYRLAVENIDIEMRKTHTDWYNNLYDDITANIWFFAKRILRFDVRHRFKLLIKGILVIMKGKC